MSTQLKMVVLWLQSFASKLLVGKLPCNTSPTFSDGEQFRITQICLNRATGSAFIHFSIEIFKMKFIPLKFKLVALLCA